VARDPGANAGLLGPVIGARSRVPEIARRFNMSRWIIARKSANKFAGLRGLARGRNRAGRLAIGRDR
jgi:hypothetical protein